MFDSLAEKLQGTLSGVRGRGTLSDEDIDAAMREIRLALLEADVNFKVVKDLVATLKERCRDAEIVGRLNAGQQVVKIVAEGLTELMGGSASELAFTAHPPTVILMAGLQGSGKTTACAKLARQLSEERSSTVALAACDTQRPAAIEQLVILGERAGAETYERGTDDDPVEIAAWALERARSEGKDVLIVDTSGRLHVDEALMDELRRMRTALEPDHVLLVVDAMTGQDAVNVAERFAEAVEFDGIVMSKLDGDARGGAALSVKALSGRPIVFASTGERLEQFELFHPDRMAQRILGMGDVMSLIEKAEREFDEDEAQRLERKLRRNEFGLDDFLAFNSSSRTARGACTSAPTTACCFPQSTVTAASPSRTSSPIRRTRSSASRGRSTDATSSPPRPRISPPACPSRSSGHRSTPTSSCASTCRRPRSTAPRSAQRFSPSIASETCRSTSRASSSRT